MGSYGQNDVDLKDSTLECITQTSISTLLALLLEEKGWDEGWLPFAKTTLAPALSRRRGGQSSASIAAIQQKSRRLSSAAF
jgi:hypothetical protein